MDERDRIKRLFDGWEDKPKQTVIGAATDELWHIVSRLRSDIRSFEWEMLPAEEKERIERETAERHAIIEMRRAERYGQKKRLSLTSAAERAVGAIRTAPRIVNAGY